MIYIIADDLTGATDTGVQFSKQGYTTDVVIISDADDTHLASIRDLTNTVDALVVDTETRETDAATARARLRQVLQALPLSDADILYKKVDSTLRGNVGAELDECLNALKKDVCLFTPSFPQNKRITVEGYLIVHDQPLGLSEYYAGSLDPGEASYIPSLLQQDTALPIARIDLKDVAQGEEAIARKIRDFIEQKKKILVIDAMNDHQLREILQGSFQVQSSILYAGSAGLANAISEICNGKHATAVSPNRTEESVMIVCGSMRSIAHRQIEFLKHRVALRDIALDVERLLSAKDAYLQHILADARSSVQNESPHIVLYPDPVFTDAQTSEALLSRYHLNFRSLGVIIRDSLAELAMRICEAVSINNLILTGGDTAIGVCERLGIRQLTIVEELLPGIPLSLGRSATQNALNIVTKAGGFGEEDALYVVFQKLAQQRSLR
ncbi:type III effector Hrp-dependent outer protein [Candidatus Moduliflexus flocculans]|uniref:Type III effector Hrp-dependent outer protein n=1 Tax=Candidatus Moduliflexus flocculans TaxID=1499966 RepID=A0A0S6VQS1_9BACT|nr:type III effector Hrp-dependent outer protein [Candidatus Moduliflexus flocculans]